MAQSPAQLDCRDVDQEIAWCCRWARGQEEITAARAAAGTAGHFMGMDESEVAKAPGLMPPQGMAGLVTVSEMAALAEEACLAGCEGIFVGESPFHSFFKN